MILFCFLSFSRILGELSETEITYHERIECGERFQFIALSSSWKNQRRKRRQQAREQQTDEITGEMKEEQESDGVPAKRIRLDEKNQEARSVMETMKNSKSPPLLHIEASVQSKSVSELKAMVEIKINYLNGTSGLNGVYEILQYIQNKWSQ